MKNIIILAILAVCFTTAHSDETATTNLTDETYMACKGLLEKDDCQIHNKNNQLISGTCASKMGANGNIDIYCHADNAAQHLDSPNTSTNSDPEKHKRRHKN